MPETISPFSDRDFSVRKVGFMQWEPAYTIREDTTYVTRPLWPNMTFRTHVAAMRIMSVARQQYNDGIWAERQRMVRYGSNL